MGWWGESADWGALARAGPGGAVVHAALRSHGPGPTPPAPLAAGLSRCHVRPQPRGAGPGARRPGGAEGAERSCRLPSSAARRAAPSTPLAAAASSSPQPGPASPLGSAVLRSHDLRLLPPPGAARAVQVTRCPGNGRRSAERLGFQVSSPRPAPRGRVLGPETRPLVGQSEPPAARPPLRCPCQGNGRPPLTWVPDPDWSPGRLQQNPLCLCFPALLAFSTPCVQGLGTGAPDLTTPRFSVM